MAKVLVSFKKNINELLLDPSNRIVEIEVVKDGVSGKKYKKIGIVFCEKLWSGEHALSFDTDDEGWIEVAESATAAEEPQPLEGIVESAA